MCLRTLLLHGLLFLMFAGPARAAEPSAPGLRTRWAEAVTPANAHPEYPRPQMVRPEWQNLNGLWEFAVTAKAESRPSEWPQRILVPFPVESALSGVQTTVSPEQRVWYRRTFSVPEAWRGRQVLLHFEAVDWETTVWIDGKEVGTHRGGYDPFTFDITSALQSTNEHELVVSVWDPTDAGPQPRGKQVLKPKGIFYTPTTGIWQTVWLEPVPQAPATDAPAPQQAGPGAAGSAPYIEALQIVPDVDHSTVRVRVILGPESEANGSPAGKPRVMVQVREHLPTEVATLGRPGQDIDVRLSAPKLWSPDEPFLYDLRVTLCEPADPDAPVVLDCVESYFGLRKMTPGKDERGRPCLLLNNKPLFTLGPLDQGFWPDGIYTAPTDEAQRYDLEMTKQLGFNMLRKHVKVESRRWYYWCDKLGILVWQDMPSGFVQAEAGAAGAPAGQEAGAQFELELRRLIEEHSNHPSIVMWVVFNEGWGQYDTERLVSWVKQLDPTRLVNGASGWHDRGVGDVCDIHAYPGPAAPNPEPARAAVLGEFGGLGLPLTGHTWQAEGWGYQTFKTPAELTDAYVGLLEQVWLLRAEPGLCAAVYTQTTDVETELNGLLTYDRALVKPDAQRATAANRRALGPPPEIRVVVPDSRKDGQVWSYTTTAPPANWTEAAFDDSSWQKAPGGFGHEGTPGAVVRTEWQSADIWLRRSFTVEKVPARTYLSVYHDEDCEIYINGRPAATLKGYTTSYVFARCAADVRLQPGRNTLAVHCRQTGGGQGIDVGIVEIVEPTAP
ncbi:MAG TPA: glycoside hydrolase family 2 TIM barrel-domain containing protein [Phycisphaerae bacterium]|nr:glycoside hydrolase family 2 TIM barrel-domain containing protein [Phycisphaerae bacterium]HNU44296.1 glycoside hydrolase family 2 TIM barrel-domain containing protein [Phycisphaerae bacterium]